MAKIFVEGLNEAITVEDAPDFEEACAMISELADLDLVSFSATDSTVAVLKRRLIMFVQGKKKATKRQYILRGPLEEAVTSKKKTRKKRARSAGIQKRDSQ